MSPLDSVDNIFGGGAGGRRPCWRVWIGRFRRGCRPGRGPPLLQPFYDVIKLWHKENIVVRRSQNFYIFFFLLLVIFTGGLFYAGSDLLLVIFALTLAAIFFVLAAYKASSPYSFIGAERELIQMMAYEPMVLLTAIGMYMAHAQLLRACDREPPDFAGAGAAGGFPGLSLHAGDQVSQVPV